MRILVTGRSGFIGSSLGPFLEARGHEVRGAGREAPAGAFAGCDAVVHLANIAHARVDEALLRSVNVEGTARVAALAAAHGVRRFVYLSSAKAIDPRDAYGRAKRAAEDALLEVKPLEKTILRPPLVYGPRVKANFLALMRAIDRGWPLPLASIRNRRSLVYVGNLCDAIRACLEAPKAPGNTYAVSDGEPLSTPELCRALGAALGRPARLLPFPPALLPVARLTGSLVVDDAALRGDTGWKPPFTPAEGLRATADWYRGL
jgi:nucleoside-diphosphate-sugar epimerase